MSMPKPQKQQAKKTDTAHWREQVGREGEERDSIPFITCNDEAGARHSVCDNQLDCTAVDDELSRSGWTICWLLKPRIDV